MPGLVALVSRREDVHVEALGQLEKQRADANGIVVRRNVKRALILTIVDVGR